MLAPAAGTQHALPTQPLCKDLNTQLYRIGLDNDNRREPRAGG
jgi:hypothetical protein